MNTTQSTGVRTPTQIAKWLNNAAQELDARGEHTLAAMAREEAAETLALALAPVHAPIVHRCDDCKRVVTSKARLATYFETHLLDWVLCARCETKAG